MKHVVLSLAVVLVFSGGAALAQRPLEKQATVQCTTTALSVKVLDQSNYCGLVQPPQVEGDVPVLFEEFTYFGEPGELQKRILEADLNARTAQEQGDTARAEMSRYTNYRCCLMEFVIACQKKRLAAGGPAHIQHSTEAHFKAESFGRTESQGCFP